MVERLLNLILTLNCPTVSIVEFELAPFAESNSDGIKSSMFPLKLFMKKYSLIATPNGMRAPESISIFVFSKFSPVQPMSIDIAPSRNEVASIRLISDLLGFWLAGANSKCPSTLWYLLLHLTQYVFCLFFTQSECLCCSPQQQQTRVLQSRILASVGWRWHSVEDVCSWPVAGIGVLNCTMWSIGREQ